MLFETYHDGAQSNNIARSASLNATERNVVRTAYDETAPFNVLTPRELDLVLSKINKSH